MYLNLFYTCVWLAIQMQRVAIDFNQYFSPVRCEPMHAVQWHMRIAVSCSTIDLLWILDILKIFRSRFYWPFQYHCCFGIEPTALLFLLFAHFVFGSFSLIRHARNDGNESAYRGEVKQLVVWCSQNNLELNMFKTVAMTVYFRKNPPTLPLLTIMSSTCQLWNPWDTCGRPTLTPLWKNLAEDVLLPPIKEVPPATITADTVESVLYTSITVWLVPPPTPTSSKWRLQ